LEAIYSGIAISLPPDVDRSIVDRLEELPFVSAVMTHDWSWGRYAALQRALEFDAARIQYADFDRLLRWVETNPAELLSTLDRSRESDCLIVGRTVAAYRTHPHALVQTEAISNRVVSYLLGLAVDVSAGAKVFSRAAAEFLVENCRPDSRDGHALGTDAEWPITLQRAGFIMNYLEVDGLDWETADRFMEEAAGLESQRLAAEAYDAEPQNWARRVAIAMEIVKCGFDALDKQL
jgi:hypothetical protein